ncbi:MAG: proline--tRNA ligase [Acidobacteria bacterium]|nr:MAG: proline--tRNA ligase [Acidobacteriota bacterium]
MRWSKTFIPTLRDNPADAEFPSHRLLIRGGFIRQLAAGIYSMLPLGQRTMLKIARIIREELDSAGAQEFHLPALHPADLWQESGRWTDMGETMFRLKDRTGRDLCLGMTHEEVFTDIARKEIRSYKDLPQIWYQIQTKFRDEARPKSGLLRVRQFTMKDSYSFDVDFAGLDRSYELHDQVYRRIYTRCGLKFVAVEASSGAMGGSQSQEFMVRMEAGEDFVVECRCGYAANLERAVSRLEKIEDEPASGEPRQVHTPGQKTIADIAAFLGVPPSHQIKSLVYVVNNAPALFLVRGDHQLNEAKVMAAVKSVLARPAHPEEIRAALGADAGSLGPVGVTAIPVYADPELRGRQNLTSGANKTDYHLQGVTPGRDFEPTWVDLRTVEKGEACVQCGSPLDVYKAVEVGHIFKLGTKYSDSMGAMVLTADGKQTPIVMGSYGIGLDRIMSSAVELYHDADGIIWPVPIAPFSAVVTPINYKDEMKAAADGIYAEIESAGIDALLDDRAERPGVKFKDADLIGIPFRVVVGAEKLRQGKVELFERAARKAVLVERDSVVEALRRRLAAAAPSPK